MKVKHISKVPLRLRHLEIEINICGTLSCGALYLIQKGNWNIKTIP